MHASYIEMSVICLSKYNDIMEEVPIILFVTEKRLLCDLIPQ